MVEKCPKNGYGFVFWVCLYILLESLHVEGKAVDTRTEKVICEVIETWVHKSRVDVYWSVTRFSPGYRHTRTLTVRFLDHYHGKKIRGIVKE